MTTHGHIPVLLTEALTCLDAGREGTYIDCTLGLAGHAVEILKKNPRAKLVGCDVDEEALRVANERLQPFADRVRLFHSDFRYLPELGLDLTDVRGILLDLGLSSFQLDAPERGFSHSLDGPLDMRMDLRSKVTALKILEKYSEPRLEKIFRDYGELRGTRRLAREIVKRRKLAGLQTTGQLREIIERVYKWRPQQGKIHPAAKAFQALRIEVNGELQGLGEFLETMAAGVRPGTRFAAISFHSLEDRIIKRTFLRLAGSEGGLPVVKILTKKPLIAAAAELAVNPRAHSAKLRAAERI
ncbi:MAG: 16S rRNA (cytosine(1402)-N(4))-methyltransferase RsmH [Acidobacteriota bacterium]|nr:16S rRNA (cytosine(1402)-N(4))-methyltransferase RsmH [Acidobacteriota bacterium]